MNNFTKISFLLVLLNVLNINGLTAQNTTTGNTWSGKTYTTKLPNADEQRILREADMQYSLGNLDRAYLTLEEAYALNPTSVQVLLRRATLKKVMGMNKEAQDDFRIAERLNPYAADIFGFNHSGNLINVLSSNPENALLGMTTYQRLDYYYGLVDEKIAAEKISVDEVNIVSEGILKLEQGDDIGALELIDSLLLRFPESAVGHDLQGTIFLNQEKYQEARVSFNKALSLDPEYAIGWYNLSRVEATDGNLAQSKIYLDKALELQSDLTKAYFDRALLNKKQGNAKAALADYNKVIEMKGNSYPEAYLNRGLTKKILGDFQGALNDINKIVEDDDFENPESLISRGNLYMVLDLTELAVDDYTNALQIDGENAVALYNRGIAFLILLDNTSACADLEKSKELGFAKAAEVWSHFCGF